MITMLRRIFLAALMASGAALCLPTVSVGQCPTPPSTSSLTEGRIGLFFDPMGTVTCADVALFVPTPLYIVARVPEGGIADFEIPLAMPDVTPAGMVITSPGLPDGSPFDASIYADACSHGVRPDPMTCPVAPGDLLVIAVSNVTLFSAFTGTVCFQTACPTIAGTVAKAPAYTRCDTGAPGEFASGEVMCLGFGQAPVPAWTSTWGAVKSLYRE